MNGRSKWLSKPPAHCKKPEKMIRTDDGKSKNKHCPPTRNISWHVDWFTLTTKLRPIRIDRMSKTLFHTGTTGWHVINSTQQNLWSITECPTKLDLPGATIRRIQLYSYRKTTETNQERSTGSSWRRRHLWLRSGDQGPKGRRWIMNRDYVTAI